MILSKPPLATRRNVLVGAVLSPPMVSVPVKVAVLRLIIKISPGVVKFGGTGDHEVVRCIEPLTYVYVAANPTCTHASTSIKLKTTLRTSARKGMHNDFIDTPYKKKGIEGKAEYAQCFFGRREQEEEKEKRKKDTFFLF
jgi:hypothetical protein